MRKFFGCYFRENVKIAEQELDFSPVEVKNFPPILTPAISAGLCDYKDIYHLSLEDFMNMNEILMVKNENERRAHRAAERKHK
jgi:hypothetical protein